MYTKGQPADSEGNVALDFDSVIQTHRARYPQMEPQDYGKLAYQNEFGPEHMAPEPEAVLSYLRREWETISGEDNPAPVEDIGNGLSRFHLTGGCDLETAAPLLAKLFLMTAQEHRGSQDGLFRKLEQLSRLDIPGLSGWLAEYKRQGCPAVHHSEAFRAAYHPHYRLLRTEYARCFSTLLAISQRMQAGKPTVVAIDGRCGSGKTHFSALLQKLFPCNVIHTDDFYLPFQSRTLHWEAEVGGNMDFPRLLSEILIPACSGSPLTYRPYDCHAGFLSETVKLPACPLTVVEGSYSTHPHLADKYDIKIFITCSQEEQERRLKAREGGAFSAFQNQWTPFEERYIKACQIKAHSDFIIDTSDFMS